MNEDGHDLVKRMHREAVERARELPLPPIERPTIHYTELPEAKPGDVFYKEWNTYRREVGRLLSEGHEGHFALIKDETIVGIYDNWEAARGAGFQQFRLEPFLVQRILTREPLLRLRGCTQPCPS
jgi:hypothetical protein